MVENGGCGVELIPEVVMCHTHRFQVLCAHSRVFVMLGNHQGVRLASADEFWESMVGCLCDGFIRVLENSETR